MWHGDLPIRGGKLLIEQDEERLGPIVVEAVPPRRRDVLAILLGRYRPSVRTSQRLSIKGINELVKPELRGTNVAEQTHASTRDFLDRYQR